MTTSRLTSIITFYMFAAKSVKAIPRYLNSVWISLTGLLTVLVQPMWLYFLSTPFVSSTSSSAKAFPSTRKTTRSSGSTPLAPTPSSKKNGPTSKKSATRSTSLAWIASLPTAQRSQNSSTGQITSSNPKPKKRGPAQASSSQANGASSAKPKRSAGRGRTSTQS